IFNKFKTDPIGAYVLLKRYVREQRITLDRINDPTEAKPYYQFITMLEHIAELLEKLEIIKRTKPHLSGHEPGNREGYARLFEAGVKPDFMFTKLMASYPKNGREIKSYTVKENEVIVFELDDDIQYLYHVLPPEFRLPEEHYELLDQARQILSEHKPERKEFVNPERMREVFMNLGHDLLEELAGFRQVKLTEDELKTLTEILVRYTVGFGLIEVLLADENIQDITINSPMGNIPMYIVHAEFGECKTNIIPSVSDGESWASKLRIMSGRPLDEADPVLDTEIEIPGIANARVGVIAPPLDPTGIAYAFRRHRDKPWTLPLFVKNKMINNLAAGLLSFLIDGNRTMLIAGTRSAGKSSLLGSLLVEIMRKYRIITIEDTLELPTTALRQMGYNIQPMKVAGALSKGDSEVPADEGIRTTLRMGDSALIIGEVRSKEARALYEAMRVGALANVVAGTIHGDSPYGVFDRVVNDLDVPRTSFKATDIIVVANPIKSADGMHKWRRVTQITEVRKQWEHDPLLENGFVDLMKYNAETDELEPTDALINGDSDILKSIAGNVREWASDWDAVWENIELRAKIKGELLKVAEAEKDLDMIEAAFVIQANDEFHRVSDKVKDKFGRLDPKEIFFRWKEWLTQQVEKRKASKELEEEAKA
ncbi:type II/IV secretion system ATPase subunit, partial [Candidatus Woesearchaeota archaeon]|nr:type II/IV secretion system ATPase subunit [Candidatus Woesearchaeota archaeon]